MQPKIQENILTRKNTKEVGGSLNTDIKNVYKFKEILGGGTFGTVRVGYKKDNENKKYAIKSISKKNLKKNDLENLLNEVEILSSLDHPNIIKLVETYQDQYYLHIVTELCRGKDLFARLSNEQHVTEKMIAGIIFKVLSAVNYLHCNGITHRDIKPENILFDTPDADAEIKLLDFGLSQKFSNEKLHSKSGTPFYIAPEVIQGEYDQKCDIWSIGILTYLLLSGRLPFYSEQKDNKELFKSILTEEPSFTAERWRQISKKAIDFISKCLVKNPQKRFASNKAMEHSWFNSVSNAIHSSEYISHEALEHIRTYDKKTYFKKMILTFLVNMLSQKELKKLQKVFQAMDLDNSGKVTKEELAYAFQSASINVSCEELEKIIEEHDGGIKFTEFVVASLDRKKIVDREKLTRAFKYFDVDEDGYIDSGDINNALLRSGKKIEDEEEFDKILEEVEKKKNMISLDDFYAIFEDKDEEDS